MKIFVLGGDGFCGWPTALKLAKENHEVWIIDNLSRRKIDLDLKSNSLTDIEPIGKRVEIARKFGWNIKFWNIDIAKSYGYFAKAVNELQPDAIVHFAEQRAAPYSMIGQYERRYTVDNNISATHNVLNAIVDHCPSCHLVHLGTMGVYGYSKEMGSIPEGYLDITVKETNKDTSILYPTNPGSVYHMTKSMDQLLFQFYNKNWNLHITDLHQGIVWGTQTEETSMHKELVNRFDYDGIYGTVLNRFISQAATGQKLTVYGTGGQKRAFIHIQDTANCVKLAIENKPNNKKVRILNQVSEVRSVKELAKIISNSYGTPIEFLDNPRKELSKNELEVNNQGLKSLGFNPITLSANLIDDVRYIATEMKKNIKEENIRNSPKW
jgi:UDP-sulfoquinovose synthase